MPTARLNRRHLLRTAACGGAGLLLPWSGAARAYRANEKLNVAIIGVGGRGRWFVDTMPRLANVVALCDVNDAKAGNAYQVIPQAKKYYDSGGSKAWSHFDYGGPLTEFVLLGNVATWVEGPIEYDAVDARIVNHAPADAALRREYREGWSL